MWVRVGAGREGGGKVSASACEPNQARKRERERERERQSSVQEECQRARRERRK